MAKSYIGIISPRGLVLLVPETEETAAVVMRRTYGERSREQACCWAVMPDTVVDVVQEKLSRQRFHDALVTVSSEATCCGTILPPAYDDTS